MLKKFTSLLFLYIAFHCEGYEVRFEGVSDPATLELIQSASQLEKLKDSPPSTANGLRHRAENDLINIAQALQSLAYYHPKLTFEIDKEHDAVIVNIQTGPKYPLGSFQIIYDDNESFEISLCELNLEIGSPAIPEDIINAEDILLDKLNIAGYAFASIIKRDVLVDQSATCVGSFSLSTTEVDKWISLIIK